MSMKVKPIALSFKNTAEDIDLYTWITKHSNMSGFIKDILKKEMNSESKETIRVENTVERNSLIELDF